MLLLTLGPLIGQLSAPNMSSGAMSDMAMTQMTMSVPDHNHSLMNHEAMGHDHSEMNHPWYVQCGYCTLALNFPFLVNSVPGVVPNLYQPIQAPVDWTRSAFKANTLFLLALTRAPPYLFDH